MRREFEQQAQFRQIAVARVDIDAALLELQGKAWRERAKDTRCRQQVVEGARVDVAGALVDLGVQARLGLTLPETDRAGDDARGPVRISDPLIFRAGAEHTVRAEVVQPGCRAAASAPVAREC